MKRSARYIVSWGLINNTMSKNTKLKWRLGKLPTADEVTLLLDKGIINKDEAKEILFSQETEENRDKKSLEDEIKFLRELAQKLANNQRSSIVETIRYIETPYKKYEWYQPYYYYCTGSTTTQGNTGTIYAMNATSAGLQSQLNQATLTSGSTTAYSYNGGDFTSIKTF